MIDRQTDRYIGRWMIDRQTHTNTDTQIDTQTNRCTDGQTHRRRWCRQGFTNYLENRPRKQQIWQQVSASSSESHHYSSWDSVTGLWTILSKHLLHGLFTFSSPMTFASTSLLHGTWHFDAINIGTFWCVLKLTIKLLWHQIKYKITTSLPTLNFTQLPISISSPETVKRQTNKTKWWDSDWVRDGIKLAPSGGKYRLWHKLPGFKS